MWRAARSGPEIVAAIIKLLKLAIPKAAETERAASLPGPGDKRRDKFMDPTRRYHLLGRLIETMPEIPTRGTIPRDVAEWLGKMGALVGSGSDSLDKLNWEAAVHALSVEHLAYGAAQQIPMIAYTVLSKAELAAPEGFRGTFIPAGGQFDAFAALSKIGATARSDIFIVD